MTNVYPHEQLHLRNLRHAIRAGRPSAGYMPVCEDDRQYIGWNGQRWTTHDALAATHIVRIGEDAGLHAFALSPDFAIPQRMLLLTTECRKRPLGKSSVS